MESYITLALTFLGGLYVGTVYARERLRPKYESLEKSCKEAVTSLIDALKERDSEARIAAGRNVLIGTMGQDIERLKLRETEARKILRPLAEHDPAVRAWLGVEVPRTVSLISTSGNVTAGGERP